LSGKRQNYVRKKKTLLIPAMEGVQIRIVAFSISHCALEQSDTKNDQLFGPLAEKHPQKQKPAILSRA